MPAVTYYTTDDRVSKWCGLSSTLQSTVVSVLLAGEPFGHVTIQYVGGGIHLPNLENIGRAARSGQGAGVLWATTYCAIVEIQKTQFTSFTIGAAHAPVNQLSRVGLTFANGEPTGSKAEKIVGFPMRCDNLALAKAGCVALMLAKGLTVA